jgi:hypothetical protein
MSFVIGLLVGLTSMGGAALMTPLLVLGLGLKPVLAVGTDLACGAVTKLAGAWMHWKQGTVDVRVAAYLACGSIPAGVLGVLALTRLQQAGYVGDVQIRQALGIALLLVAAVILGRALGMRVPDALTSLIQRHIQSGVIVWGALVGFLVGMTSVGSGSLIAPLLLLLYPKDPARAVGTDVFHAGLLVTCAAVQHSSAGNVDWQLVPVLLTGSVPGVLIGSYLTPRLPARSLRFGIGVVLFATGWKLV